MVKSTEMPFERRKTTLETWQSRYTTVRHLVIRLRLAVPRITLRRSRVYMLASLAPVGLIAVGGAANAVASHGGPANPLSCKQQYVAWTNGPVRAAAQQLRTDLTAMQSVSGSGNVPQITYGLKRVSYDTSAVERYPMPGCADPAGYWAQSLTYLGSSAARGASDPGSLTMLSPAAFMQRVRSIRTKLSAELARTVQGKG